MGKKINPKIFRIGITKAWPSKWFASGKDYARNVEQDINVRRFLLKDLREAGVDRVEIENWLKSCRIKTASEIDQEASSYVTTKKGGVI